MACTFHFIVKRVLFVLLKIIVLKISVSVTSFTSFRLQWLEMMWYLCCWWWCLCLCGSYQRTSSPCSRKFFRLGSVCCRSGVVKPCWYLSCKKKRNTPINLKQHHHNELYVQCVVIHINTISSLWYASARAVRHKRTYSMYVCVELKEIQPKEEVYIVSAWHVSILTLWLLLIWTQFHPSLIPGMCTNT